MLRALLLAFVVAGCHSKPSRRVETDTQAVPPATVVEDPPLLPIAPDFLRALAEGRVPLGDVIDGSRGVQSIRLGVPDERAARFCGAAATEEARKVLDRALHDAATIPGARLTCYGFSCQKVESGRGDARILFDFMARHGSLPVLVGFTELTFHGRDDESERVEARRNALSLTSCNSP